jgi:hypothetical protein
MVVMIMIIIIFVMMMIKVMCPILPLALYAAPNHFQRASFGGA